MTTKEEIKKHAVVFEEGTAFRAVASWIRAPNDAMVLSSIELEVHTHDAMGAPRWQSAGFVISDGAHRAPDAWLAGVLSSCAGRWLKENA